MTENTEKNMKCIMANPMSNLRKGAAVTLTTLVLGGCESTGPLTQEEKEYVANEFSHTLFFTPLVEEFAARADSDKIYGVDGTTARSDLQYVREAQAYEQRIAKSIEYGIAQKRKNQVMMSLNLSRFK